MPVVTFHLVDNETNNAKAEELLQGACALYAEVLEAPIERIRAFITMHRAEHFLVHGQLCSKNGVNSPFFDFIIMNGRPIELHNRLMAGFTDLLVDVLGVKRDDVRGICRRVEPEDWCISGVPASEARKAEVEARKAAAAAAANA